MIGTNRRTFGAKSKKSSEFEDSQKSGNQEDIEGEFGDLMFSLINFARLSDIDPELALERTNKNSFLDLLTWRNRLPFR